MSIETTNLLMETVMVFVGAMEVAAVVLTALGLCLLAAAIVGEARRAKMARDRASPSMATGSADAPTDFGADGQLATGDAFLGDMELPAAARQRLAAQAPQLFFDVAFKRTVLG